MKRELLIAAVLLAAGGMLWAGQNGGLNRIVRSLEASFQKNDPTGSSDYPGLFSSVSQFFGNPAEPEQLPLATLLDQELDIQLNKVYKISLYSSWPDDPQANQFLEGVAANLKNSPPLTTEITAKFRWQGQEFHFAANYSQIGKGSGQSRLDLTFRDRSDSTILSKVCDGRFLYTLEVFGEHKKLEFVDLQQIRRVNQRRNANQIPLLNQGMLPGELASLIENLSLCFQFDTPQLQEIEGQSFCHLQGVWRADWLRKLLHEVAPQHHLEPQIIWHKLPDEIPHHIQLSMVHSHKFGWIPHRLIFLRYVKERKQPTRAETAETRMAVPIGVIDFASFQFLSTTADELLSMDTAEIETVDVTYLYLNR